MSTPFNTGKVQIGCKAEAPTRHEFHDADALRLQRALLGEKSSVDWDGIACILIALSVVGLAVWGAA